jgi:hypothetical protein
MHSQNNTNYFKPGDLVLKNGDHDKGCKGIILEVNTNSLKTTILKVLKFNGAVVNWYAKLVEHVNNNNS